MNSNENKRSNDEIYTKRADVLTFYMIINAITCVVEYCNDLRYKISFPSKECTKYIDASHLGNLIDGLNKNLCLYDESLYKVLREIN